MEEFINKPYIVLDTENKFVSKFASYNDALAFKMLANRPDWVIKKARENTRKVTERMKQAVAFIEFYTPYTYDGDIEEFQDVFNFICQYLDFAKEEKEERDSIEEAYYDNMGYDDWRG